MTRWTCALAATICLAAPARVQAPSAAEVALGPGRPATPAVVNPPMRSGLRTTIRLDGTWDFATDPGRKGLAAKWFLPGAVLPDARKILVPGCWEAQGVGGPGKSIPSTPEKSVYQLRGSHVGTAWYRKRVDIPKSFAGRRVRLKIGGLHVQGWLWVNGAYVAHVENYCGAYKYDVTDLISPGKAATIAVMVRNDVTSGKGLFGWIHRFGGLYRGVEIDATGPVFLDNVHVEGRFDARSAAVHVKLRSTAPKANCRVEATVLTLDGKPAGRGAAEARLGGEGVADVVVQVPLKPFTPWSPARPHLYKAQIVLKVAGETVDGWTERFGVRKWEVRGGQFHLNGRPFFVRGFGDDYIYPLTIASPADRKVHRKHLATAKAFGFNYARLHTHCEVPEYFQAADEVGILVQPELPYYGSGPSARSKDKKWFRPKADLTELITHYRRYVSLATYCGGNEGHMGSPIDRELYQLAKKLDPTRLFLHQDGGRKNSPENSDFDTLPHTKTDQRPWFVHEYANLATDFDLRLRPTYTGVMLPPGEPARFRKELAESGLDLQWGYACLDAGNALQRIWQKRHLEGLRMRPAGDGYTYWTIVDCGHPSSQGLFTQFWRPKAGSSAARFQQFNGATALPAKFTPPERILAEGDTLKVQWWISHFGEAPIRRGTLNWKLRAGDKTLASGKASDIAADIGHVKPVGEAAATIPPLTQPVKARLEVALADTKVTNDWEVWLFPKVRPVDGAGKGLAASKKVFAAIAKRYPGMMRQGAGEAGLLLTDSRDDAFAALKQGRRVLLLGMTGRKPGVELGWWWKGPQMGVAIADHAAFGKFPHDGHLNELFFRLAGRTAYLNRPPFRGAEPLMAGNGYDRRTQCSGGRGHLGYLAYVLQGRIARGKLLACGLDLLTDHPEAAWLLHEFIAYAASDRFDPKAVLQIPAGAKR